MQNGARTGQLLCPGPDGFPIFLQQRLAGGDELRQFAFGFEFDFQFCDVEIFGVPQLTQKNGVHQLGNALGDFSSVGLLCHFKEDDLGRCLGVDEVEQIADAVIANLLLEEFSKLAALDRAVLQSVAEVLGKRTLTGPEEARHPHAHAFVRISGSLSNGFEEMVVLFTNAVGGDVFRDFGMDGLLVRLIDLDDLLDLEAEVSCQQFFNGLHLVAFASAVDFDSVVPQRIPILEFHESQAGRAFNGAGIEQDRGHLGFAVHFVEQHRHVENAR